MGDKLTDDFLNELFKACIRSKTILETCIGLVKYEYLPNEPYKEVWKAIRTHFNTKNESPTFGVLSQYFTGNIKVLNVVNDIKQSELKSNESLFERLEEYIKRGMFVENIEKVTNFYNEGKIEKAFDNYKEGAESVYKFNIHAKSFEPIFGGFWDRMKKRTEEYNIRGFRNFKVSFGIDQLDEDCYGGVDNTDTAIILAPTGIGKSKALKHIGIHNARFGRNVLHVQLEGSKKECEDAYDAGWTGELIKKIAKGEVSEKRTDEINKVIANMAGEVRIEAHEKFDTAKMTDVRKYVIDYEKTYDKLHLLIIDYMDLLDPGDGRNYTGSLEGEKAKRQALAKMMKNLALEQNIAIITATQASDVSESDINNPKFYLTKNNISYDKNLPNAFSYFLTLNQTRDEYKNKIMRIYEGKIRHYPSRKIIKICTNYDKERFYNRKATIEKGFYLPKK